jgi:hypothetical protein
MLRACCVVGLIALAIGTASADPNPEAEKLFRDGRKFLAASKLPEACDAFAASSKIEPTVGTLLNLGDCRAKLGQTATAWAAFIAAGQLAHQQRDPRKAEADRRSSQLEPTLSYLTIAVPDRVAKLEVDRDNTVIDPTVWGRPMPLDPGQVAITVHAPGYDAWSQTITLKPGGDHQVVTVPPLHAQPVVAAPTIAARPTLTRTREVAIGVGGAGVVALIVSGIVGLDAISLENEAMAVCPQGKPCHDLTASQKSELAVSRASLATEVGVAGAVAVAAGVTLWFVGRPRESATGVARIIPTATPDSVALALVGRF